MGLITLLAHSSLLLMIATALLILVVELAFFQIPGLCPSTLIIALACMKFGFVPSLAVVIPPILIAHLIWIKNPSIVVSELVTMVVMVLFGAYAGPFFVKTFGWNFYTVGWGFYGMLFGVVKWGTLTAVGLIYGGNITKRLQNLALEPVFNFFIFWKLMFLFGFLTG